jgi:hypothetical protein
MLLRLTCYLFIFVGMPGEAAMRIGFLTLAAILSTYSFAAGQQIAGSVCVVARVDDPFWNRLLFRTDKLIPTG